MGDCHIVSHDSGDRMLRERSLVVEVLAQRTRQCDVIDGMGTLAICVQSPVNVD